MSERSLEEQETPYLQICSVKPVGQETGAAYNSPHVPDKIKEFYSVNKVSRYVKNLRSEAPMLHCHVQVYP